MSELLSRLASALADHYVIDRELGAGGMATVFLASDRKHERSVALKVLRPELSAVLGVDRFLSEIHVTAHLQHPHILPLFDSGTADGLIWYAMPYVEGESLRAKLRREKQLSVEEALGIAVAVAGALDYAHRHDVIHRDIKPENILLQDGQPVVADFGIALALSAAAGTRLTETGLSLGTPQYMSPEQATGERQLDRRTDIYSLGGVVYEMLAGDPPFMGSTVQSVLAQVVADRPRRLSVLRETVPLYLEAAVAKALAKAPADRFPTASEFAEALTKPRPVVVPVDAQLERAESDDGRKRRSARRSAVALGLTATTAAAVTWALLPQHQESTGVVHFTFAVSAQQVSSEGMFPRFALAPDGSALTYAGPDGLLQLRRLDTPTAMPLAGSGGAVAPAFSDDGQWLAFLASGALMKVRTAGGPAVIVAPALSSMGLAWSADGSLILAAGNGGTYLQRVSDQGGAVQRLESPSDTVPSIGSAWPQVLPGGDAVLFTAVGLTGAAPDSRIIVHDLATGVRHTVVQGGTHGRYIRNGFLLYALADGTIMAAPFSLRRREVTGPAFPALSGVQVGVFDGAALFDVSSNGTLAYVRGNSSNLRLLRWVDEAGRDLRGMGAPFTGDQLSLSPDGSRLAVTVRAPAQNDIRLLDAASGQAERLTLEPGEEESPVWSADGRAVAYASTTNGFATQFFTRSVDSTRDPQLMYTGDTHMHLSSWSPDGQWLAFEELGRLGQWDLGVLNVKSGEIMRVAATPAYEGSGVFSPDGRWLAFHSNESGRLEVYIIAFPELRGKRAITTGGGWSPRWARDGSALFYREGGRLMRLPVSLRPSVSWGSPRVLFEADFVEFDLAPDGRRFLLLTPSPEAAHAEIHVVVNWLKELEDRVRRSSN